MSKLDLFTEKRMLRFIEKFRVESGQLPTIHDFKNAGFYEAQVEQGLKQQLIEQFYVTLTSGTILRAFKARSCK